MVLVYNIDNIVSKKKNGVEDITVWFNVQNIQSN